MATQHNSQQGFQFLHIVAAEYGMLGALKGKITLPDGEILPFASPKFWDDIIRGGHDGEPE